MTQVIDKAFEKLVKSIEALRPTLFPETTATLGRKSKENNVSSKERISHCHSIADTLVSPGIKAHPEYGTYFSKSFDMFLALCNDVDANVRMVADSSLNRVIKHVLLDSNATRIQVELYKEMKKNGPARSLRAALTKFAELAPLIRPTKASYDCDVLAQLKLLSQDLYEHHGRTTATPQRTTPTSDIDSFGSRVFAQSLVNCVTSIIKRPEESVQECIGSVIEKIWTVLGPYFKDEETKNLIQCVMGNLQLQSLVTRRTAATCLVVFCQYHRRSLMFVSYLLKLLLESILPVKKDRATPQLLGTLLTLKKLVPLLKTHGDSPDSNSMVNSVYGSDSKLSLTSSISFDHLLQLYEVSIHYMQDENSSVCAAALETLNAILRSPPSQLHSILLNPTGIQRTMIFAADDVAGSKSGTTSSLRSRKSSFVAKSGVCSLTGSQMDISAALESPHIPQLSIFGTMDTVGGSGGSVTSEDPHMEGTENPINKTLTDVDTSGPGVAYSSMEIGTCSDDEEREKSASISDPLGVTCFEVSSPVSEFNDPLLFAAEQVASPVSSEAAHLDRSLHLPIQSTLGKTSSSTSLENSAAEGPQSPNFLMSNRIVEGIGDYVDPEIPLIYCSRLLCSRFLLSGIPGDLIPDKDVRVSHKTSALSCVSSIVGLYPKVFNLPLLKDDSIQCAHISDIVLFGKHADPQLRSCTAELISIFLSSIMTESCCQPEHWINTNCGTSAPYSLESLVLELMSLLHDENGNTTRCALAAVGKCWACVSLLRAPPNAAISILQSCLKTSTNAYWLTKAELSTFLSSINFCKLRLLEVDFESNNRCGILNSLQNQVLDIVMCKLLANDDLRVQTAAAQSLVRMIPNLYFGGSPIIDLGSRREASLIRQIRKGGDTTTDWPMSPLPMVFGLAPSLTKADSPVDDIIDANLSQIVHMLFELMIATQSKTHTAGCVAALTALATEYSPVQYRSAWYGAPIVTSTHENAAYGCEMVRNLLHYLQSTSLMHDFTVHQNIFKFISEYFSGICVRSMLGSDHSKIDKWLLVNNPTLKEVSSELLIYCLKFLNCCWSVITDQYHHQNTGGVVSSSHSSSSISAAGVASTISRIPSLAHGSIAGGSPVKSGKTGKGSGKGSATGIDDAGNQNSPTGQSAPTGPRLKYGECSTSIQFSKLVEMLRGSYFNFKISLDPVANERFLSLIRSCLMCLCHLFEVMSLPDTNKYTEELLMYLRSITTILPVESVYCVQQVLKALFGTNLTISVYHLQDFCTAAASSRSSSHSSQQSHFLHSITSQHSNNPSLYVSQLLNAATEFAQEVSASLSKHDVIGGRIQRQLGWMRLKNDKHVVSLLRGSTEKSQLTSFIRMFEPMVIQALKLYTNSNNTKLQRAVIALLVQLIHVRVNYTLLDADMRFLRFVNQQLEDMEEIQLASSGDLIGPLFEFLVTLSYEKTGAGALVVEVPTILQLIDGLLALSSSSERSQNVVLDALHIVTVDLQLIRPGMRVDNPADVETQKEVILSAIVKSCCGHHHEALLLLCIVVYQAKVDKTEKWRRISRDFVDTVLPIVVKQQLKLDTYDCFAAANLLFDLVCPSAFRPMDIILKIMFDLPEHDLSLSNNLTSWLAVQYICLRIVVLHCKEDSLLARLEHLNFAMDFGADLPEAHRKSSNYQNTTVSTPEETDTDSPADGFARLLLTITDLFAREILFYNTKLPLVETPFLTYLCSKYLQLLGYVLQTDSFRRLSASLSAKMCESNKDLILHYLRLVPIQPQLGILFLNTSLSAAYRLDKPGLALLLEPGTALWTFFGNIFMGSSDRQPLVEQEGVENLVTATGCISASRPCLFVIFAGYAKLATTCESDLNGTCSHLKHIIISALSEFVEYWHEAPVLELLNTMKSSPSLAGELLKSLNASLHSKRHEISLMHGLLGILNDFVVLCPASVLELMMSHFINNTLSVISNEATDIGLRCVEMMCGAENPGISSSLLSQFLVQLSGRKPSSRVDQLRDNLLTCLKLWYPDEPMQRSISTDLDPTLTVSTICSGKFTKMKYVRLLKASYKLHLCSPGAIAKLLTRFPYSEAIELLCNEINEPRVVKACLTQGLAAWDQARACASPPNSPANLSRTKFPLLAASRTAILGAVRSFARGQACSTSSNSQEEFIQLLTTFLDESRRINMIPDSEVENILTFVTMYAKDMMSVSNHQASSFTNPQSLCSWLSLCRCITSVASLHRVIDVLLLNVHSKPTNKDRSPSTPPDEQNPEMDKYIDLQIVLIQAVYQATKRVCCDELEDFGTKTFPFPMDSVRIENSWKMMSSLLHWMEYVSKDAAVTHGYRSHLPVSVVTTMRGAISGISRFPIVCGLSRVPEVAFKFGWVPTVNSVNGYSYLSPSKLIHFLQNSEILRQFVFRINTLGWCSRKQFEETWMALVGVLCSTPIGQELNTVDPQEVSERITTSSLAVRCLSSMLLQTLLYWPGNPQLSAYILKHREQSSQFMQTNHGHRLLDIKRHLRRLKRAGKASNATSFLEVSDNFPLYCGNPERIGDVDSFGSGQLSIRSLWLASGVIVEEHKLMLLKNPSNTPSPRHDTGAAASEKSAAAPMGIVASNLVKLRTKVDSLSDNAKGSSADERESTAITSLDTSADGDLLLPDTVKLKLEDSPPVSEAVDGETLPQTDTTAANDSSYSMITNKTSGFISHVDGFIKDYIGPNLPSMPFTGAPVSNQEAVAPSTLVETAKCSNPLQDLATRGGADSSDDDVDNETSGGTEGTDGEFLDSLDDSHFENPPEKTIPSGHPSQKSVRRTISNFLLSSESLPDVVSSVTFLLDLFNHWLEKGPDSVPIALLSATVECMVLISDVLSDRSQFEKLREKLRLVYHVHYEEDELIRQYLIMGLLKCDAVLGIDNQETKREVMDLVDKSLNSLQLGLRLAGLQGALYVLQNNTETVPGMLELLGQYVIAHVERTLLSSHQDVPSLEKPQNQRHQLTVWAVGFYLIQQFSDDHTQSTFLPSFLELCFKLIENTHVPNTVYSAVMHGLDSLLITSHVTGVYVTRLIKLLSNRIKSCMDPMITIPAMELLLTCLYTSEIFHQFLSRIWNFEAARIL